MKLEGECQFPRLVILIPPLFFFPIPIRSVSNILIVIQIIHYYNS